MVTGNCLREGQNKGNVAKKAHGCAAIKKKDNKLILRRLELRSACKSSGGYFFFMVFFFQVTFKIFQTFLESRGQCKQWISTCLGK